MTAPPAVTAERDVTAGPLGLAHVASCSFLASRIAPRGEFFLALGGGIALARTGAREGARVGYGASAAAIVQTVALIGPARVNGPLTQAISAPVMGVMQGRGRPRAARLAVCLALRLAHYAVLTTVGVAIIAGGLDEFVATYDKVAGWLRVLPTGQTAALVFTAIGSVFYALIFSVLQTIVYDRALRRWPATWVAPDGSRAGGEDARGAGDAPDARGGVRRAAGIRAPGPAWVAAGAHGPAAGHAVWTALAAVLAAWVVLLAALNWVTVGAVAAALAVLTAGTRARRAGRSTWTIGLVLAAVLTVGALMPGIIGAVDFEPAAQRAARAVLLVLTATWARAFAGTDGLRHAARAILWRLRAVPAAAEAAAITTQLESDTHLRPAAGALIDRLKTVELTPVPVADALTDWVVAEAAGYRGPA